MKGGCHCGRVSLRLARRPDFLNPCNCSLCMKLGAAWGYLAPHEVSVAGTTSRYERGDVERPAITLHFCGACGATVRWTAARHLPQDRMGINMRLFEPAELAGMEVRYEDARTDPVRDEVYRAATIFDGRSAIP